MSSAEVLASVDIVALRLNPGHGLELLLIRRAQAPFAGQWALPGVLVNGRSADHSLDDAAVRANRYALLAKLRGSFLGVADISLLG
mgnify:CR=1 FL=1